VSDLAPHIERPDAEQTAELLRALAHPVRLTILGSLRGCERAVGEIEAITGIGQPGLSQQLAVLRKANLVLTRREAKQIHYRIDTGAIAEVRAILGWLALPLTLVAEPHAPTDSGPVSGPVSGAASPGTARSSRASGVAVFARINR
jgi:DNA-binding transcriptional ArsR family regulator